MLKISDKLSKVNEYFQIHMYENGFMVEVSGRDDDDDYKTAKIMCQTLEELQALVAEAVEMERES